VGLRTRALEAVSLGSFYKGRRVLVTGHTGFKGGWLCLLLKALGAKVTGFALAPEHGELGLFAAARVSEGMDSVLGDARDAAALSAAYRRAEPELVFHLAAQALVRRSYADPAGTWSANVDGTVNLLEACRARPPRAVVVVTSDKCYANEDAGTPRKEEDALGGKDPYSASKAAQELVAASYRASWLPALATARAGNVIGGGDWAQDRLLPDCVRAWRAGKPVLLRRPEATRPWQHVLEPVSAYLLLGRLLHEKPAEHAEAWNFGPGEEPRTVGSLARRAAAAWGDGAAVEERPEPGAPYEAPALRLDPSKAARRLGWRAAWDAERAVDETLSWYRAQHAGRFDGAAFCAGQIDAYSASAAARP
jgi:CDP-glucose 4,6-dehydratase